MRAAWMVGGSSQKAAGAPIRLAQRFRRGRDIRLAFQLDALFCIGPRSTVQLNLPLLTHTERAFTYPDCHLLVKEETVTVGEDLTRPEPMSNRETSCVYHAILRRERIPGEFRREVQLRRRCVWTST